MPQNPILIIQAPLLHEFPAACEAIQAQKEQLEAGQGECHLELGGCWAYIGFGALGVRT